MSHQLPVRSVLLASVLLCAGCNLTLVFEVGRTDAGSVEPGTPDAGGSDAGNTDAGTDAGNTDAGNTDAGKTDSGTPDAGTPDSGTPDAGKTDAGTPDAGTPDAGTPDAGTPDAGTPDAGTPDAGTPDAGTPDAGGVTVHLDTAAARVSGRRGQDLTVSLTAHDTAKRIAGVMVRVSDSSGGPIAAFDSHQSGALDSDIGPAALAASALGLATVSTTATAEGLVTRLAQAPGAPVAGRVLVSLRDAAGNASNEILATVADQPVRQSGEACDLTSLADRCAEGLGCTGAPATCKGVAPEITQLAFLRGDAGPTLLIAGTAPGDEVDTIRIDYEDATGAPKQIVIDPGPPPVTASGADVAANGATYNGLFLVTRPQVPGFDTDCPQVGVTATDKGRATGATKHALPANALVRASGAVCDLQGFDQCGAGLVCAPGTTSSTCQSLTTMQTARCAAAVTLAPLAGAPAQTFGHTAQPSLWDAPRGCSGANPMGRPEGVIKLVLAQATTLLTLSLDNPGTDFDTTLYLLPGCPSSSAANLGCNDDSPAGVSSLLNLPDVPAGTYTVVIDSFKPHGGNYQLTATVQ